MAGLLDDSGFGGLLGNPLFNMGLGVLAASGRPGATFGGAVGQGGLLGMQNLQQARQAQGIDELRKVQLAKAQREMAQEEAWRKMFGMGGAMPSAPIAPNAPNVQLADASGATPATMPPANPVLAGLPPQMLPVLGALGPEKGGAMLAQFAGKTLEAPKVETAYDPTGHETKMMWDRAQGKFVPLGGVKTDLLSPEALGQKKEIARAGQPVVSVDTAQKPFYGEVGQLGAKDLYASRDAALAARDTLNTNTVARGLLDKGIISGTGANARLEFARGLATVGLADGTDVANTDAFFSTMGRQTLGLVKQLGAGNGISNADREYADKVAGGNIAFTEQSLRRLLDINDRAAGRVMEQHNSKIKPLLEDPNLPPYIRSTLEVPMPTPQASAQKPVQTKVLGGKKYLQMPDGKWYTE